MKGHGEAPQYSVFICDLPRARKSRMQLRLGEIIDHHHDSIVLVDLGLLADDVQPRFEFMGVHRPVPKPGRTLLSRRALQ
jgi:CRISPR-associated protein Cas2